MYSGANVHPSLSIAGGAPTGGKPLLVIKTTRASIDRNLSFRYAGSSAWAAFFPDMSMVVLFARRESPPRENNKNTECMPGKKIMILENTVGGPLDPRPTLGAPGGQERSLEEAVAVMLAMYVECRCRPLL